MAKPKQPAPDTPPQRRNRIDALSSDAGALGAAAFARAGFTDPTLVLHWEKIAGAEVARLARPLRLSQGPQGGVLTLMAEPAAAVFLSHETRALAERINNWIYRFFSWLFRQQTRARWVGRALVWGFLTLVGVGLIWGLLQMERRWRIRLVPDADRPAPGAASARDWQLWLNDAREAAARGQWREAIHFLYWAAISRLESKKLWPADRARTPREYLALVAADDPRKSGLGSLTREFEWTWYGGRPAAESDYHRADELATALFEGGGQANREAVR